MRTEAIRTVGFLGVGLMGAPMVRHLLRAGFVARAWNRTRRRLDPLIEAGATPAATPDEAGEGAEVLRPRGVDVLIEPLNPRDMPAYLLGSFDLARTILSRCPPGIGLQFDAYHVTRMGLDLVDELERALPYVCHVQFADVPGRREPGTGSVPFREMLGVLLDGQYRGWLGAEYFPSGATDRSSSWLADWRAAMSVRMSVAKVHLTL